MLSAEQSKLGGATVLQESQNGNNLKICRNG
jgi:hypothetical protein